jgi:hypothetical protein
MLTPAQPRQWQEAGDTHIDVRGLMPPQPLIAILRLLASAAADTVVIVHLDRDPVMLYPELPQMGWGAETIRGDAAEVRLRLRRTV